MPTQSTTYNSRVTDEALEKRFRDTFRSQGGAELVDDLYAQGVIVPIVDFTAAATGQQLAQNLQTAWDFSTGHDTVVNQTTTLVSNSGFWQVDLNLFTIYDTTARSARIYIDSGIATRNVWEFNTVSIGSASSAQLMENTFVVFLRAGDSLVAQSNNTAAVIDVWYRQIATVDGDLVNPTGFTSS